MVELPKATTCLFGGEVLQAGLLADSVSCARIPEAVLRDEPKDGLGSI